MLEERAGEDALRCGGLGRGVRGPDLDDGLRPGLVIKGVGDPLSPKVSKDPAVVAAREAALLVRKGAWPQFYWNNSRERKTREGELRYNTYLSDVAVGVVPTTFWADDDFETVDLGSTSPQRRLRAARPVCGPACR